MDWQNLSPKDFLSWLSIEGLDASDIISKNYAALPLPLRVAFWHYTAYSSADNLVFPKEWPMDRDMSFRIVLVEAGELQEQVHQWLQSEFLSTTNAKDFPAKIIQQAILLDKPTLDNLETLFDIYQFAKDIKIPETDSEWDAMWRGRYPADHILTNYPIPITCLDRWRHNYAKADNEYILSHALINKHIEVPPHWMPEITGNTELLSIYLCRTDVPLSTRMSFRSHPDEDILSAAWAGGPVSEEEINNIPKNTLQEAQIWEAIANNPSAINSLTVPKLLLHAPSATANWAGNQDLPDDLKILAVKAGYSIDWATCQNQEILQLGIDSKNPEILVNMVRSIRRSWSPHLLFQLAERVLSTNSPITDWDLRRLFHLGSITPDKSMLKSMISHKTQPIRLLAASIMSAPPAHNTPSPRLR